MRLPKLKAGVFGVLVVAVALGGGTLGQGGRAAEPVPKDGKGDAAAAVARLVEGVKKQPAPRHPKRDELGLFLMDLDKGDVTLVASAADKDRAYCGSPSWSADGRRILFDASPGFGRFAETRVQVLEMAGAGVSLTTFGPGNCPSSSPDGRQLAHRLNAGAIPGVEPGLYLTKPDGSLWYRVDHPGFTKWSPGGKHLLAVTFANPCELSVVSVEGGEVTPVRVADHRVYSVPSWAGEGVVAALVRSDKTQKFDVALVDVTDPEKAVVKEALWRRGDNGLGVEPMYPVYSPAAKRGAFVGREPKGQALYALEPGKAPRRLEPERRLDPKIASLALSPDGRYLLFCSARPEGDE